MRISPRWFLTTSLLLGGVVACSSITIEGGIPVRIELVADRSTAVVSDTVRFTYDARGTSIEGVYVDFGDGVVDTTLTLGANSASGIVSHAWNRTGTFTVVARAEDLATGVATAQVVIQVGN